VGAPSNPKVALRSSAACDAMPAAEVMGRCVALDRARRAYPGPGPISAATAGSGVLEAESRCVTPGAGADHSLKSECVRARSP
jgi:hypothetical protein